MYLPLEFPLEAYLAGYLRNLQKMDTTHENWALNRLMSQLKSTCLTILKARQ